MKSSLMPTLRTWAAAALLAPTLALAQLAAPVPPEIAARNYLLFDATTGQVLAAKDIDAPVEQASLTKLMTGYVVFDALRAKKISLEQTLPVSERAWKMPGSRMFIDPKMQVKVDDLLHGMIVQSGNDATMALAEGVGGTAENFVRLMNEQAKALGMTNTAYKNPEGLTEPGHTTTAKDLSILANRLMKDFPEYMHYYSTKQWYYPGTPKSNGTNRNTLLFRDPTVDGLKTGHTNAAGYCLVSTAKRQVPNAGDRRLISILLGAASDKDRANESQKLLNWGYTAFDTVKLFDGGQPVATPKAWKGAQDTVKMGSATPIIVNVPAGTGGKLETQVVSQEPLIAPFTKGQKLGSLKVMAGGQQVAEVPLVALEDVGEAGIFGRAWDAIRLWIK
ncbi:D-alanyl-D-alanine carboxypeptidase family protein [Comamonas odontotermitis]|uniref:serine-type D-Ala-D-Ala carboxypeptidase n=1 Tax=Comamonas odontotermitis TaxID=379895 RepID=A0ABR6RB53_9BURK|nr:D-alanyl-D-alanine carboxypeptidase family protein [Comamonas odontotermitis]MBB6576357.1 D-alanyl-D-alanine carboxypeptidase (penicillin-binding protein 5/6) [Comamonas odontotermitis]UBB17458.1 D-alanyl-D-alanine carboxypeptidase [Comamonas odontotermitis]